MPQRHSKNNNDLAFFTYDEKRKLGYGTQKERLGKDSIKPIRCLLSLLETFHRPAVLPEWWSCLLQRVHSQMPRLTEETHPKKVSDPCCSQELLNNNYLFIHFDKDTNISMTTTFLQGCLPLSSPHQIHNTTWTDLKDISSRSPLPFRGESSHFSPSFLLSSLTAHSTGPLYSNMRNFGSLL
ncbi:PREDICTED: uncharacterized protein LOC109164819 [Ipomoea nil]|uniref:uncharacterized protein LOC109164819 n=1 Tax=Ipomoea nil TaxID=35883 RepID=UPI0009012900|nr:PREDICTED: uncharacterized protein LOC109164819 [Ipomoea nil]